MGQIADLMGESFAVVTGDRKDSDVHPAANKPVLLVYLAAPLLAEERNRKIEASK